jgi:hypothetical protein
MAAGRAIFGALAVVVGMGFAWLLGGMATVVKLFGDYIVAEQDENGTFTVRRKDGYVLPYRYAQLKKIAPKCYLLGREGGKRYDLIFANGCVQFGYQYIYELGRVRRQGKEKVLIGIVYPNGVGVLDEEGNFLGFIPGHNQIIVVDDRFLVVLIGAASEPYVKVYDLFCELLAEGFMSEALEKARSKVGEW